LPRRVRRSPLPIAVSDSVADASYSIRIGPGTVARARIAYLKPERTMALVVFRSKAAAEIFMFAETARRLLQIVGKADSERGVIRAAETAGALSRLVAAVEQEKAQLQQERARQDLDERAGDAMARGSCRSRSANAPFR